MHYLRPQEWSSFFTALRPVQVLAAISFFAIYQRGKPIRAKDLWDSPQDYAVTAYFAWTIYASTTPGDTFRSILPLIFFYFVGVLTLTSLTRLRIFLAVWATCIVAISALALASRIGFDPLDSLSLTEGVMKGRMVLNLSIFNNPNGLGHAIVPVIPMLYYLLFWKRVFAKPLIVVIAIPIAAIFETLSKGAFVSAGVTILATLCFGRPRMVQIAIVSLAFSFGGTLMYALPRMNELRSSKSDEAIQGRVAAYQFGLHQMQRLTYGHGLGNFTPNFFKYGPTRDEKRTRMGRRNGYATVIITYVPVHYTKAPHSAYVQNGADLGYIGLFLFIGVLYTCVRTLVQAKTANDEEEMIRRTLFAVVVSYAISSWMVDFCYRPTFFFFAAAVGGLHRYLRGRFEEVASSGSDEEPVSERRLAWRDLQPTQLVGVNAVEVSAISHAPKGEILSQQTDSTEVVAMYFGSDRDGVESPLRGSIKWARIGWIDIGITYLLTEAAVRFWVYLIENM